MRVDNNAVLAEMLFKFPSLASAKWFEIDEVEFQSKLAEIVLQHPKESVAFRQARAVYRCLTTQSSSSDLLARMEKLVQVSESRVIGRTLPKWAIIVGFALLALLIAVRPMFGQNVNPAIAAAACGGSSFAAGQRAVLIVKQTGELCITGSLAIGATDTDDNTVAGGQATSLNITLPYMWTGSGWVRVVGTAADGLLVNLGANNDVTVTGTVTANAGTDLNTSALATSANQTTVGASTTKLNDGTDTALVSAGGALLTDASATTQPVSATNLDIRDLTSADVVTVTDGAGALNTIIDSGTVTTVSTVTNLSQLAGVAISMNTGVRDTGTQRVTIATNDLVPVTDGAGALNVIVDSITAGDTNIGNVDVLTIAAGDNNIGNVDIVAMPSVTIGTFPDNEPLNVAQINGVTPLMGNGVTGTGSQRVTIASDNTAFTVNTGTFPDNEPFNVAQFGGTAVVTGGTAGLTGIGGPTAVDSPVTGNPVRIGGRASTALPTAVSADADVVDLWHDRYGSVIVRKINDMNPFSCGLSAIGTTLTQCQAAPAAGLSLYITDIKHQSNTTTTGLFTLRFGTGANCGTGTGNIFFASASALIANGANTLNTPPMSFQTPIKVTAANAICVLGVATNTTNIQINGYTAP